jgi:hypothetical protein
VIDPLGPVLTLIRSSSAVAAITPRVRGADLAEGDAAPAVVVRRLGVTRSPLGRTSRLGLEGVTLVAICFGTSPQQAAQLFGAVSDAVHNKRARIDAQGRLIFLTVNESGGDATLDPDTRWPREDAVINVIAAAQAVA